MEEEEDKKIIQIGKTYMSKPEFDAWSKLADEAEKALVWGIIPESWKNLPPEDSRKWALIKVDGKSRTVPVCNKTMKAYETVDGYTWTWNEIPKFEFVRWARGMDL